MQAHYPFLLNTLNRLAVNHEILIRMSRCLPEMLSSVSRGLQSPGPGSLGVSMGVLKVTTKLMRIRNRDVLRYLLYFSLIDFSFDVVLAFWQSSLLPRLLSSFFFRRLCILTLTNGN